MDLTRCTCEINEDACKVCPPPTCCCGRRHDPADVDACSIPQLTPDNDPLRM